VRRISQGGWSEGPKEKAGQPDNFGYVIEHRTADGLRFLAIYGHLRRPWPLAEGSTVTAGETKLGELGEWYGNPHLHFGIYTDPNRQDFVPSQGYGRQPLPRPDPESLFGGLTCYQATNPTYRPSDPGLQSYGYWVEPVRFMRTHRPFGSAAPKTPEPTPPVPNADLSGRWEGKSKCPEDGINYDDKVTILQAGGKVYQVMRRHNPRQGDYVVTAGDSPESAYFGEWDSTGTPHILEQRGSWEWATHIKRWRSQDGEKIEMAETFPSGKHHETSWYRVAALATMPKIGEVIHESKGLVKLGEEVVAGELNVGGVHNYLLLMLNYPGSKLDLIVTDPDGKRLSPDSPGVTYLANDMPARMFIERPKSGRWSFKVKGVQVPGVAEPFWLIGGYTDKGPHGETPLVSGGSASTEPDWQMALLISLSVGIFMLAVVTLGVTIRRRSPGRPSRVRPVAWLQVYEPGAPLRNVPMTGAITRVGRGPGNMVRLSDPKVSAHHAEIRVVGGSASVQDLGSTHGTWVNGERVARRTLRDGDRIKLGDTVIVFIPREVS